MCLILRDFHVQSSPSPPPKKRLRFKMIDEILGVVVFFRWYFREFSSKRLDSACVFCSGGRWFFIPFCIFCISAISDITFLQIWLSSTDVFLGIRIDMLGLNHPKKGDPFSKFCWSSFTSNLWGNHGVKIPPKPDLFFGSFKRATRIPFKSP